MISASCGMLDEHSLLNIGDCFFSPYRRKVLQRYVRAILELSRIRKSQTGGLASFLAAFA